MKIFLTRAGAQLAIVALLVACHPSRPSITSSPLPNEPSLSAVASPSPTVVGDPFAKGVDKAASASRLEQSAQTAEDWSLVITQWQRAIAFMKVVPVAAPNHTAAQKLLLAYQQNLSRVQQQVKRGGASRHTVAAKGNTDDSGIPIISGSQSSARLNSEEATTTAVATVNALLQQQTEFSAKQKRFAASLTELGGSIPAETPSYTYSTSILPSKQAIATATAKQDDLPSYTGAILLVKDDKNNDTTVTTLCLTSKPAKVAPGIPQVVGKEIQCPAGSSKL